MNEPQPEPEPRSVRVASHGDLLTAIPRLLGHVPDHSVVTVGLCGDLVTCTARTDLPGTITTVHQLMPVTAQLRHCGCDGAIIIAYGPADLAEASLDLAANDLREADIDLVDRLRVTDGRYHCTTCTAEGRSPDGGAVPESTTVATELAFHGATAMPSRAAITALLDPASEADRAAVARALDRQLAAGAEFDWGWQRQADLDVIGHWLTETTLPGPDDIARLALAVGDLDIRDHVLAAAEPYLAAGQWPVDLWLWVTRHIPEDMAAPCASLLAWFAYRRGNPVLAAEAAAAALRASPAYRLAGLLVSVIDAGIPPNQLPVPRSGLGTGPESSSLPTPWNRLAPLSLTQFQEARSLRDDSALIPASRALGPASNRLRGGRRFRTVRLRPPRAHPRTPSRREGTVLFGQAAGLPRPWGRRRARALLRAQMASGPTWCLAGEDQGDPCGAEAGVPRAKQGDVRGARSRPSCHRCPARTNSVPSSNSTRTSRRLHGDASRKCSLISP